MRVVAELGLPLIVKPAREGSTIGITKVAKRRSRRACARVRRSGEARPAGARRGVRRGHGAHRVDPRRPRAAADPHRGAAAATTTTTASISPTRRSTTARRACPTTKERRSARCALRAFDIVGCARLGPARPDPARRRHVLVPRGEHVAGHDRATAWCRWPRKRGRHVVSPTCASRSCEGAHVG